MEATLELIRRLRRLTAEVIPPEGVEADTHYTDTELQEILLDAASINKAAYMVWIEKAAMFSDPDRIKASSIGKEKYEKDSLKDLADHALKMAKQFKEQSDIEEITIGSALLLSVEKPSVL